MQILILANHSGGLYPLQCPTMTGGMNCRRWLTV